MGEDWLSMFYSHWPYGKTSCQCFYSHWPYGKTSCQCFYSHCQSNLPASPIWYNFKLLWSNISWIIGTTAFFNHISCFVYLNWHERGAYTLYLHAFFVENNYKLYYIIFVDKKEFHAYQYYILKDMIWHDLTIILIKLWICCTWFIELVKD